MAFLWGRYVRFLDKYPLLGKCVTVSALSATGDFLSQKVVQSMKKNANEEVPAYNFKRTLRMATFGMCIAGPMNVYWYKLLDVMVKHPGTKGNLMKLAADQLLFAPVILSTFFTSITMLEGGSLQDGIDRTKAHLWPSLKVNWMVWPAAQYVNFTYVPAQHRVGYVSAVLVVWNGILSYLAHKH